MGFRVVLGVSVIALAGSLFSGCTSSTKSGGDRACAPGETRSCTCPPDRPGTQVCQEGFGFGECECADGGTGQGGAGGSGGLPPRALDCDYYCAVIEQNCAGEDLQYSSAQFCFGACNAFPAGSLDDDSGNTLGCRILAAEDAANSPGTLCVLAGPSGGGGCGSPCDGYCSLMGAACELEFEGDTEGCLTACEAFTDLPDQDYSPAIRSGDSLECRIYHANAANVDPPSSQTEHCPHSGVVPASQCLDG